MRDRDASQVAETIKALPEARQQAMLQELNFFGLKDIALPARPWFEEAAFALAPEMDQKRYGCAAILHGRRVVLFGGRRFVSGMFTEHLASTKVFNLHTMTFGSGPQMSTRRCACAAVVFDARRALVVGGYGHANKAAEILDLETMVFSAGPEMLTWRMGCAAVALDARRVLVAGGDLTSRNTTEILELESMTFTPGPEMISLRCGCAAVALDAHRALIIGGESRGAYLETTEVLDIRTMAFSPGPSMRSKRRGCVAVPLDSRHRLIIGGCKDLTTEVLDIETMEFRDGPEMNVARFNPGAVVDGERVLVFGGDLAKSEILSVAQENEGLRRRRR